MVAVDAPCSPWTTADEIIGCQPCSASSGVDEDHAALGAEIASAWLWRLSGRRYSGICSTTVRPVPRCIIDGSPSDRTLLFDSRTGGYSFGSSRGGGRNEGVSEITLGHYPIREITQVKIDGAVLDPAGYRLDDASYLVRLAGESWPHSNDLGRADTEAGTWSVSFRYGDDPPVDGQLAAKVLACEIALSCAGKECRLPKRITNLTRQGVSMVLVDPGEVADQGRFGIAEVDLFLNSVNPGKLAERATVVSPDVPRAVRRTGTTPGS
jgi:hypothetical protein